MLSDINEYGSNARGSYLKLSSGVVIEWNTIYNVSSQTLGQAYLDTYLPLPLANDSGTFGIATFYDSFRGHGSGSIPNLADITNINYDSFTLMLTINNTYDTGNMVRWIIIGRWK